MRAARVCNCVYATSISIFMLISIKKRSPVCCLCVCVCEGVNGRGRTSDRDDTGSVI